MADSDTFGDPSLFEEFEKERQPPDKMLLDKFKNEISPLSKGFFPVKHARAADEQSMQVDEGTAAGAESGSNSGIDEDGVYSDGDEGEGSAENGEPTMADEISAKISQIRRECSNHDNGSYGGDNRSNLIKEIMELRRENILHNWKCGCNCCGNGFYTVGVKNLSVENLRELTFYTKQMGCWVQPPILMISSNLAIVAKSGDPKSL